MPLVARHARHRAAAGTDARPAGATASDATDLVALLDVSRRRLHEAVRRVPAHGWRARAGGTGWTACEILEHLALTEWAVLACVRGALDACAGGRAADACAPLDDAAVLHAARDRTVRREAPERLRPAGGRWARPAALCASMDAARDAALALAAAEPAALRACLVPHPELGRIDGAQWLLFLAGHMERHVAQLDELTAASRSTAAA